MRKTIRDVAESAGCSITTVSQILNGKGQRFSPELRETVLQTAYELGYSPDPIAVSMITGRTNTIGLILPNIHNMFFALLAEEIEEYCRQLSYNLILCNSMDNADTEQTYIEALLSRKVDGVLLILASDSTAEQTFESYKKAKEYNIPICLVDRMVDCKGLDTVSINHKLGGYLACQHLLEGGHRRLAFLTGPKGQLNSQYRLQGALKAIQEFKGDIPEPCIFQGDYSWECGYKKTEDILDCNPSAIFAFNDWSAFGIIMKLHELRINVPDDLSIIAYDDIPFLNGGVLSLSTIHQPIDELAKAAIETLLFRLNNPNTPAEQILIDPRLIVRQSCKAIA